MPERGTKTPKIKKIRKKFQQKNNELYFNKTRRNNGEDVIILVIL